LKEGLLLIVSDSFFLCFDGVVVVVVVTTTRMDISDGGLEGEAEVEVEEE